MGKSRGRWVMVAAYIAIWCGGRNASAQAADVIASYRGAYVCSQGQTDVLLSVIRKTPATPQTVMFSFGPTDVNPSVPRGKFLMKGQFDLHGGSVDLRPIRWIDQPDGFVMVGLVGISANDGAVIQGRVIGPGCSSFFLARTGNATAGATVNADPPANSYPFAPSILNDSGKVGASPGQAKASQAMQSGLCLDGFCIGQSIRHPRFGDVNWIMPKEFVSLRRCTGVGCQPDVGFRGYSPEDQKALTDAVQLTYGLGQYNLLLKTTVPALRRYTYECNLSARGLSGERRFLGAYRSDPSGYVTIIGLRLMNGELRVYRIARQFPYHNPNELVFLAEKLHQQYGDQLLVYRHLTANAYSDVIAHGKNGWFGRASMFNPSDLSDNMAELVLIDPATRALLEPTSMPESGDIKPLPLKLSERCNRPLSIQ